MAKYYASLTGPLLGLYFPLPDQLATREQRWLAMNSSKLAKLWCSVYDEQEVDRQIKQFGGEKLSDRLSRSLDYDHHTVFGAGGLVATLDGGAS